MDFTLTFMKFFQLGLSLAAPLILSMLVLIIVLALIVHRREGWTAFDAIYWALITALTVGYGDIRPSRHVSKVLSIIIAMIGLVLAGIVVAIAVTSAAESFKHHADIDALKEKVQDIRLESQPKP